MLKFKSIKVLALILSLGLMSFGGITATAEELPTKWVRIELSDAAQVSSDSPDNPVVPGDFLITVYRSVSGLHKIMYFKFDVSSVKPADILEAKLHFKWRSWGGVSNLNAFGVEYDGWDGESMTFNTKPPIGTKVSGDSVAVSNTDAFSEAFFDVTDYIKAEAKGDKVAGVVIERDGAAGSDNGTRVMYKGADTPYLMVKVLDLRGKVVKLPVAENAAAINTPEYINNPVDNSSLFTAERSEDGYIAKTFLRFDLSKLTAPVKKAELYVYWRMWGGTTTVDVYPVDDDNWERETLTYSNMPDYGDVAIASQSVPNGSNDAGYAWTMDPLPTPAQDANHDKRISPFDVTEYIIAEQNGDQKASLGFKRRADSSSTNGFAVRDRESSNGMYAAYLLIEYEPGDWEVEANLEAFEKDGIDITEGGLQEGDITCKIGITNNRIIPVTADLIMALFDGNMLKGAVIGNLEDLAENGGSDNIQLSLPVENISQNTFIKLFLWEGVSTGNPITKALKFDGSGIVDDF
ncbi:MAG: DNRLRE domain-containing protein [Firmicutes bacterium]|nr:DNRLRE domain-containing protein [Bacillota bacterium]